MTGLAKLKTKMAQGKSNAPRAPEITDLPNAVPHRRSLPAQIDMIEVEDRLRSVDEAAVDHIAESMEQRGQIYPIQIRTIEPGRFRLLTGAHRMAAARKLGWTHIEAFLVDDLEGEEISLLEIDENLCRAELNPIDKAHFFATRKEIYQRLYPETKHGGDRKSLEYRDNINGPQWPLDPNSRDLPRNRPLSFAEDTAASTPWSPRTIKRYTRIGERLNPDLRKALSGTPVGRRLNDLERIADMKPDKQQELLVRFQESERPPVSLAALTTDPNRPSSPAKSNLDKLTALWSKTSADHRRRFIEYLRNDFSDAERDEFREWLAEPEAGS